MKLTIFSFLAFLLFVAHPALARDNWCQPTSAPVINIRTSTDQISYDFNQSEKQLNSFSLSTVNPYGDNVITDVGGLMKGGIETQQKMSYGTLTNQQTREICYWHDTIDVLIHIRPTIYIASEFPPNTCMHNAIMGHEQKHIMVDREIVNKYAALIGKAIRDDVSQYRVFGPVPVSQQQALHHTVQSRMKSILNYYTAQMSEERKNRQQQIDSLSEYERVNHLCPR